MSTQTNRLPAIVQAFFERHLVGERNLSPNTALSYRDALALLFRFAARSLGKAPDTLAIEDLHVDLVRQFLEFIRGERACSPRTRNQRLAALKSFFRYVASVSPEHLDRCRQIREIRNQKVEHRAVQYLEPDQVAALCRSADETARHGVRDLALLALMYNTGARVQEVADLDVADLRLETLPKVRLRGKGRKERDVPLWSETVRLLQRWLGMRPADLEGRTPLFVNSRGQRLTRWGIADILKRAAQRAGASCPALNDRQVSPHVMRHTTAMDLLRSGADLCVIAAWLGHASITTSHGYVEIDLRMKQAAVADATACLPKMPAARYPRKGMVAWLEALGRRRDYVELARSCSSR